MSSRIIDPPPLGDIDGWRDFVEFLKKEGLDAELVQAESYLKALESA